MIIGFSNVFAILCFFLEENQEKNHVFEPLIFIHSFIFQGIDTQLNFNQKAALDVASENINMKSKSTRTVIDIEWRIKGSPADEQFGKKNNAPKLIIIQLGMGYSTHVESNILLNIHFRTVYLNPKNVQMPSAFQHFYAPNIWFYKKHSKIN